MLNRGAEKKKQAGFAEQSMTAMLSRHSIILIIILTIPLLFMLLSIRVTLRNYDRVISNVEDARQLKNTYVTELDQEIWLIVSGRKTTAEGQQHQLIADARARVDSLLERSSPEALLYLTAAERSIDSAELYVKTLEQQIAKGKSARSNTKLHDEISSVCRLTEEVLGDYIEQGNQQIADWNGRIQRSFVFLTLIIILLIATAALLTINMARKMSQKVRDPILELESFAAEVAKGSFESRVGEPQLLDLKQLSRDLNTMALKLDRYFQDKLEAESNLQKAELKALQAQIQPHFIYNTLGTIVWLAEQERSRDVINMTMAFTRFLRLSLSGGKEIITVEQEVEHVKSYLEIQGFRYGSQITYEILLDPSVSSLPMLKFTLQPLVENAIYHGIKGKRFSKGHITIRVHPESAEPADETNDWVHFSVNDTGQGITPARLQELRERLAKVTEEPADAQTESADAARERDAEQGGYGLVNVASRLWLYYRSRLQIESKLGEGTEVSFAYNRSKL